MRQGAILRAPFAPGWTVVTAAVLACLGVFALLEGAAEAVIITLMGLVYLFLCQWFIRVQHWPRRFENAATLAVMTAFFTRLATSLFFFPLYMTLPVSDPLRYIRDGRLLSKVLWQIPVQDWPLHLFAMGHDPSNHGTLIFMALHFTLGFSPYLVVVSNAFFAAFGVALLLRLTRRLYPQEDMQGTLLLGAWLWALFPLGHYWGAQVLKDSFTAFLTLVFVDQLLGYLYAGKVRRLLVMALMLALLVPMRFYYVPILAGAALAAVVLHPRLKGRWLLVLGMAAAVAGVFASPVGREILQRLSRDGLTAVLIMARENASSVDAFGGRQQSLGSMVSGFPAGLARLYLSPLPVFDKIGLQPVNLWNVLCTIPWFLLLPFYLAGAWKFLKDHWRTGTPVWVFVLFYSLFFSLVVYAPDPRRNLHQFPFWLFFSALGLRQIGVANPFAWGTYFVIFLITFRSAAFPYAADPMMAWMMKGAMAWGAWLLLTAPRRRTAAA